MTLHFIKNKTAELLRVMEHERSNGCSVTDGHLQVVVIWSPAERTMACPKAISVSSPSTDNASRSTSNVERCKKNSLGVSLESLRPLSDLFASGRLHDAETAPVASLRDACPAGVCHRSAPGRTAPIIAGLADAIAAAASASAASKL